MDVLSFHLLIIPLRDQSQAHAHAAVNLCFCSLRIDQDTGIMYVNNILYSYQTQRHIYFYVYEAAAGGKCIVQTLIGHFCSQMDRLIYE